MNTDGVYFVYLGFLEINSKLSVNWFAEKVKSHYTIMHFVKGSKDSIFPPPLIIFIQAENRNSQIYET